MRLRRVVFGTWSVVAEPCLRREKRLCANAVSGSLDCRKGWVAAEVCSSAYLLFHDKET